MRSGTAVVERNRTGHDARASAAEVRLLDGFALVQAGTTIVLPVTSQRLIAFLALCEGPVRRPFVAGNLWLEKSEARADANLRSALWRLPGPELSLVVGARGSLALAPHVRVDVREARHTITAVLHGEFSMAEFLLNRGVAELLPDWYEEWVLHERERLRQQWLHAVEYVGYWLIEARRFAEAIDLGLRAVAAEPLRESAHRLLIDAHLAERNIAEAIRQYVRFRDQLFNDLGIQPSVEMTAMMSQFPLINTPLISDGSSDHKFALDRVNRLVVRQSPMAKDLAGRDE